VTTATRRLRRAGVASVAAFATAGLALVATAGSAFAALGTITNRVDPSNGATTVYPGQNAQATGGYQLDMTNSFAIGDKIVLKLEGAGIDPSQTNKGVGFATKPTLTAGTAVTASFGSTAGDTSDVTPTFSTALAASNTTAGVNDELVITFTNSSAGTATDHFTLTMAPASVNVGSAVGTGAVNLHAYAADAVTSLTGAVAIATVANNKLAVSAPTAATTSASAQTGVALGTVTLSEVTAGSIAPEDGSATTITLTLANKAGTPNAAFTAGVTPTITATGGASVTSTPATTAGATYSFVVTSPSTATAAQTFTVKGLKVDLPASQFGTTSLAASSNNPAAHAIGGTVTALSELGINRTGGVDRYATSAQLWTAEFGGSGGVDDVVIASGANFPDALSGTYLAGLPGVSPSGDVTGVLLTNPNTLVGSTRQALIGDNNLTTVYIVGGTSAVSANVESQISALHQGNNPTAPFLNVIRIAGADRYATNNAVDLFQGVSNANHEAIVATGLNFADALSVGPAAYRGNGTANNQIPLVLTDGATLSPSAASTLTNLGVTHVTIVGGTSAVSTAVETAIKGLGITVDNRLAGADRTQTAAQIAAWETTATGTTFAASGYDGTNGLGFNQDSPYIARGDNFADALSGAGVAGDNAEVLVLTQSPTSLGAGIPSYFGGLAGTISSVNVLGLTSAVSIPTVNAAIAAIS